MLTDPSRPRLVSAAMEGTPAPPKRTVRGLMDVRLARPGLVERVAAAVALASLVAGLLAVVLAAVSSWRGRRGHAERPCS